MKDNSDDRWERGPAAAKVNVGEANHYAKITEADVVAMRASYAAGGIDFTTLGVMYGVSMTQAARIVRGVSWAHVSGAVPLPRDLRRRAG